MDDDSFFAPFEMQETSHCGPTSLSMCLGILGIYADQRALAWAAGKPFLAYKTGLDEQDLKKAAAEYGVKCEYLQEKNKGKGQAFVKRLAAHLSAGLPGLLLIDDADHWVAAIGRAAKDRFIVFDPNDDEHAFNRWNERTLLQNAWNETDDEDEEDEYFAILTSRKDGKPARWNTTEAFLRLCEKGSEESAEGMANDLVEMVRRAGRQGGNEIVPLAEILEEERKIIVDSVWHWTASDVVSRAEIDEQYVDYTVIANAAGLHVPKDIDRSALVAQMTTILA
ncbi:MAG: C39 family peptidase, partial [Deltaproteobacteria bacterium]|nr:C39 family peptidase [Deltaproteobacteria bacterium]